MKLFYSPTSPYVRKVLVVAYELGLADRLERLPSAAHPINRDLTIVRHNPLGQVPTLFMDDGRALYDSRVICEYLNDLAQGDLFPRTGSARWVALGDQALCDGMLAAAVSMRYETVVRPEHARFPDWVAGQRAKITDGLRWLESRAAELSSRLDIGTISVACLLSYLDLRFPEMNWRVDHQGLNQWYDIFQLRPSMQATVLG
ncbi:glutathione S-transferase [Dyella subtropica]|uniref:glutathione S-transferase n=1 Tax=Dyella subtropica TaxID=2992127 RepID=UPI00225C2A2C|nr:glutathione S-transferase [Dyella subtropica]